MAGLRLEGGVSGNVAEVDAAKNLAATLPAVLDGKIGFAALAARIDDAAGAALLRRVQVNKGGRVNVAQDNFLWADSFNAAAINSSNYKTPLTTMTVTSVNGFAVLNGSSITTVNTNCALQTWRSFSLFGTTELHCEVVAYRTLAAQANETTEFGLFAATLPGAAIPLDGMFWRYNAAAELRGVINFNGTETQTGVITPPSANVAHKFEIVADEREVEFWIDDVLQARITLLGAAPALGQPFLSSAVPFTARYYIGASAPAAAAQLRIGEINIYTVDGDTARPWQHQLAGMGLNAAQGQNGGTLGSTANYVNNTNPTAAVPTNTTAVLGSGLGGQFWATATVAVGTDGIVSSYQNPAGGVNATPRMLYITGVRISTTVQAALTGGPFVLQWGLAFGHTAVSLATADSLTAPSKAPRRRALGFQNLAAAAAVGAQPADLVAMFATPVAVNPGEFIQTFYKNIGTAGTAGTLAHTVDFEGYFE